MPEKEIEIKIKIERPKEIEKRILLLGGKKEREVFQRTIRLDTPQKTLEKRGIFLRVRKEKEDTMTVKIKTKKKSQFFERKEYEIKIEDAERAVEMLKILGFTREKILEKYRKTFIFKKPPVKIFLDRLPFGYYLEIEGKKKDIKWAMRKLGFSFSERITKTYWDLWKEYQKKKKIKKENITFS